MLPQLPVKVAKRVAASKDGWGAPQPGERGERGGEPSSSFNSGGGFGDINSVFGINQYMPPIPPSPPKVKKERERERDIALGSMLDEQRLLRERERERAKAAERMKLEQAHAIQKEREMMFDRHSRDPISQREYEMKLLEKELDLGLGGYQGEGRSEREHLRSAQSMQQHSSQPHSSGGMSQSSRMQQPQVYSLLCFVHLLPVLFSFFNTYT